MKICRLWVNTSSNRQKYRSCISLSLTEENLSVHPTILHLNKILLFLVFAFSVSSCDQNPGLRTNFFGLAQTTWQALLGFFFLLSIALILVGGGVTIIVGSWDFLVPLGSFLTFQLNKSSWGFRQTSLLKKVLSDYIKLFLTLYQPGLLTIPDPNPAPRNNTSLQTRYCSTFKVQRIILICWFSIDLCKNWNIEKLRKQKSRFLIKTLTFVTKTRTSKTGSSSDTHQARLSNYFGNTRSRLPPSSFLSGKVITLRHKLHGQLYPCLLRFQKC